MKQLELFSIEEYCDYLFSPEGKALELHKMLDVITTNKTDFFRENEHLVLLSETLLNELFNSILGKYDCLNIWSAGCSSGEEAYSIAITLEEYFKKNDRRDYTIYASDISTTMIDKGKAAIYSMTDIYGVNESILKEYFLRSKDSEKAIVRLIPQIRNKVKFFKNNLVNDEVKKDIQMHLVFCRNVLIYFDRSTQEKVVDKLVSAIVPGGYFFHGHSESLVGMNMPLKRVSPTVYKKVYGK